MSQLELYNQVALCMAYCTGATKENAKEIANSLTLLEISKCINEIRNMMCERKIKL